VTAEKRETFSEIGQRMIEEDRAKLATPEEHKLFESFLALTKMHYDAIREYAGPDVVFWLGIVMMAMGPRAFSSEHVTCICCESNPPGMKCMAVTMCEEVCSFADEAGHPEWVDGSDDPLEGDDLPQV
jgi:hypothetical protein